MPRSSVRAGGLMRRADCPIAARSDEGHDFLHLRMSAEFIGDIGDTLHESALMRKQQAIGTTQALDLLAIKAAPLQADNVETGEMRPISHGQPIGNEVVFEAGKASHKGVSADPRELDHRGAATDDRI